MTTKKKYNVGDTVWIYGVSRSNVKPVEGTVIKVVDLTDSGHTDGPHYVISVPTHIENLLEIRTWHNISQDARGPVGSLREIGNVESTIKFVSTVGFAFDDDPSLDTDKQIDDDDEIDPDIIHAAIEKAQEATKLQPLNLKPEKPKRRYFKKKVKNG
jgi:hypothetical protein